MEYIVCVEGVVVKENQFLIIRRGPGEEHLPGILALPGGGLEGEGDIPEVVEENLKREVLEETGVTIADEMEYLESYLFPYKDQSVVNLVFLCYYQSGELAPEDPEEVAEVMWMTYEEALAQPELPVWIRQSLNLAVQKLSWYTKDRGECYE